MPEITDDEYAVLQGSKKLMDQLLKNPKTKRETERAIKVLHPETVISEDFDAPLLDDRPLVDGHPAAYVCTGFTCRAPVTNPADIAPAIAAM
jgi:uncharacterized protein YyaL (SSP411 family)